MHNLNFRIAPGFAVRRARVSDSPLENPEFQAFQAREPDFRLVILASMKAVGGGRACFLTLKK
jgi:hypothetical protein